MNTFEEVLTQYDPMVSASMRQLNIYRNHDQFRQVGRVALWQAWSKYDERHGHFAPYASRTIRGAMLDEMNKETRFEAHVSQTEDVILEGLAGQAFEEIHEWSDHLSSALAQLTLNEKLLVQWLFIEGLSQTECAEKAGISVAGIKKRRERMLVKLRKQLQ